MFTNQNSSKKFKSCWKAKGSSHSEALLIRNVLKFRETLLKTDKLTPFPQNCCCYKFAEKKIPNIAYPLPLGVLIYLWDNWNIFTGKCSKCDGDIYGYGFGGLLSIGGIIGCCINCMVKYCRSVGGLLATGDTVQGILKSSPYMIKTGFFGGAFKGERIPLVNALKRLGENNLPSHNWIYGKEPEHVTFSIKTSRK